MDIALKTKPFRGGKYCGDQGKYWWLSDSQLLLTLCDGLGHGYEAFKASSVCLKVIDDCKHWPIHDIIRNCNASLKETRGVALALALINLAEQRLDVLSIGNIISCIVRGKSIEQISADRGILCGEQSFKVSHKSKEFIAGHDLFFMSSDGTPTNILFPQFKFHGLFSHLDNLLEEVISVNGNDNDDVSILAVR